LRIILSHPAQSFHFLATWIRILVAVTAWIGDILGRGGIIAMAYGLFQIRSRLRECHFELFKQKLFKDSKPKVKKMEKLLLK
jgi:hypothetical protein